MSAADNIVVETTTKIFQDLCDPQTVNAAAMNEDEGWKAPLWSALEDAGLTLAWVPDDLGGAGASIVDGFAVLRVAGGFAVPVPLAETLLAGWLLGRAGISSPRGAMSVAPVRSDDRITLGDDGALSGRARGVPFARAADHLAVVVDKDGKAVVALVDRAACKLKEGASLAGDDKDEVDFTGVVPREVAAADGIDASALILMGAAVRACEMAGALHAILDISVEYSKERVAFERPIAKFQAVQHNLARLAGETAAAIAAAGSVADAIGNMAGFDDRIFLEVAAAKIRVGEAAGEGAAIAHQAHGAIGFTLEHILHRYTRRLWSWRDDFGSEADWAVRLGEMVAAQGADELWPMVTQH